MNREKITVTILTKNSERYLDVVLGALTSFGEVLVLDNGSTDSTIEIARRYPNVVIHYYPEFIGYGPLHNRAVDLATHDWILSIDSDEIVETSLSDEINLLQLDPKTAYSIPRKNFYNGKWIRGCGWWPDRVIRLFHRRNTRFNDRLVHESVVTEGVRLAEISGAMQHYSYGGIDDFLVKMRRYANLWAEENQGKKSTTCKAALHAIGAFWKSYLLKGGFRDGGAGFVISSYNGHTAFYKYLLLKERNERIKEQAKERDR